MKIQVKNRQELIKAALGKIKCDLLIKNANILNLFTGEIYPGDVGIYDGFIAHIEANPDDLEVEKKEIQAKKSYDAKGKYLIPGLIDSHVHIESTMMTPRNFAKAVIPHGTTTAVTDPHEIANVLGIEAVEYMHESSQDIPMRQYILAPSCVPAIPGAENSGAEFHSEDIEKLLELERVIGLAEVMDFVGVLNNDKRMVDIVEAAIKKNGFIQGHAPGLEGRELSAYISAGPISDHESRTAKEARDKMRLGMFVDARESSMSKDVEALVSGVKDFRYLDNLTFCTDDVEPGDIVGLGHMNNVLKVAVKAGLDPIDAIRSATYNAAREIGIENLGAIAPGYVADLVITESLEDIRPQAVFYQGELVAEEGELLADIKPRVFDLEEKNTIYVNDLKLEDFKVKAPIDEGQVEVNIIKYKNLTQSVTELEKAKVRVKDGYVDISDDKSLKFVTIINRHKGIETMSQGLVRGTGIELGSVGSTVSHDSHNITIVYESAEDALAIFEKTRKIGGGISCARDGKVLKYLELPVAGLMSTKPCQEIALESDAMKKSLRSLGLREVANPLLRIATLALAVIPEVKMSDLGLIDVGTQKILPLFTKF